MGTGQHGAKGMSPAEAVKIINTCYTPPALWFRFCRPILLEKSGKYTMYENRLKSMAVCV